MANASLRVQVNVASVQLQFVPAIAVGVKLAGKVSVMVTVPEVAEPPLFVTVIVYAAPVWPCVKFPEWLLLIVRSGGALDALIVVTSVAVSFAVFVSPPPDTVAAFVTELGALLATLTVRVIVG